MNNQKYTDIKANAIEIKDLNLDFELQKNVRMFYDSSIIKSSHAIGRKNALDELYFEVLLAYHDEMVSLDFKGVSDIVSESTLSYFPGVREIKICKIKDQLNFQFLPMYSRKLIKFNFHELKATSYLIEKIERGQSLGSI